MAGSPDQVSRLGIVALPTTTVRQLGSSQALVDPSFVVKELIDNALDARASSIFVDISADTINTIVVKGTGHGIQEEDQPLIARRYCTSKIRDFHDVRDIGGNWLGFRGTALANIAEMSGTLEITTRVEGDPVARTLRFGGDGELILPIQVASAAAGTTVKVTGLFDHLPVRKLAAPRMATKWLAKIKRTVKAYALARPTVRFRFHVLKADNRNDFVYAPKAGADVEDSALKVIGRGAFQYDWISLETNGFDIRVLLPTSGCDMSRLSNDGPFLCVDCRPVSCERGILKQITTKVKDKLEEVNANFNARKNIFFLMDIKCPKGSYDLNIEPAKDDVLFQDPYAVLEAVDELMRSYHSQSTTDFQNSVHKSSSAMQITQADLMEAETRMNMTGDIRHGSLQSIEEMPPSRFEHSKSLWRSNMYGVDEDDLEMLAEIQSPMIEEEQEAGGSNASFHNPWTFAKMHAASKATKFLEEFQCTPPANSQPNAEILSSLPAGSLEQRSYSLKHSMPHTPPQLESRQVSLSNPGFISLDSAPTQDIQPLSSFQHSVENPGVITTNISDVILPSSPPLSTRLKAVTPRYATPRRTSTVGKLFKPVVFEKSLRDHLQWNHSSVNGATSYNHPQEKRSNYHQAGSSFHNQASPQDQHDADSALNVSLGPARQELRAHPDIRNYFGQGGNMPSPTTSFTPINKMTHQSKKSFRTTNGNNGVHGIERYFQAKTGRAPAPSEVFNPISGGPSPSSKQTRGRRQSGNALDQLDTVTEVSIQKPTGTPDSSHETATPEPQSMAAFFEAYIDREPPSKHANAPIARQEREIKASPGDFAKLPPIRRQSTANGLRRSKSWNLPLERVPHDYHSQSLVLSVDITVGETINSIQKLDMTRNTPWWGYPVEHAYDELAVPITEDRLKEWVLRIVMMLDERCERIEKDMEVGSVVEEGIRNSLKSRKRDEYDVRMVDVEVTTYNRIAQPASTREEDDCNDKDSGHGSDEYDGDSDEEMLMDILAEMETDVQRE